MYGRSPTTFEFKKQNGYPGATTYYNHFGTFNNALRLAGLEINQVQTVITGDEICELCGSKNTIHNWSIRDNKRVCNKCACGPRYYVHGILDPTSSTGIGVITETVVKTILQDCTTCNTIQSFTAPYDLISEKYGTINVKSSIFKTSKSYDTKGWIFAKKKNQTIPDYYVCIGFDETRACILHVWIIPGTSSIVTKYIIYVSHNNLQKVKQYEVDSEPYNRVYQELDIYTLPEFRNLNKQEGDNTCECL